MDQAAVDFVMARITGVDPMGKDTGSRGSPTRLEVEQRAYRRYEERGRVDGHDVEDWVLAEQELAR
jgi:hypothetical protein